MSHHEPVVRLLDAISKREGFKSDTQLGAFLGVSEMTVYRWRRGIGVREHMAKLVDEASRLAPTNQAG